MAWRYEKWLWVVLGAALGLYAGQGHAQTMHSPERDELIGPWRGADGSPDVVIVFKPDGDRQLLVDEIHTLPNGQKSPAATGSQMYFTRLPSGQWGMFIVGGKGRKTVCLITVLTDGTRLEVTDFDGDADSDCGNGLAKLSLVR